MHKFLGQLIDAEHKTTGHTVLYIPDEGPIMTDESAHLNKEFVQRMEGKRNTSSLDYTTFFSAQLLLSIGQGKLRNLSIARRA